MLPVPSSTGAQPERDPQSETDVSLQSNRRLKLGALAVSTPSQLKSNASDEPPGIGSEKNLVCPGCTFELPSKQSVVARLRGCVCVKLATAVLAVAHRA